MKGLVYHLEEYERNFFFRLANMKKYREDKLVAHEMRLRTYLSWLELPREVVTQIQAFYQQHTGRKTEFL